MATASSSPSAAIQAQNSPRSRQSRRSSTGPASHPPSENSSPSLSVSGTVDQEQFLTSSSTTSSDSFPSKEASTMVAASRSLADGGFASPAGVDAQTDSSENDGESKKPAWNKPSNGPAAEVGAVMGADFWPALSEAARASPKSSSTDSLKALSHGSIPISQGMAVGSLSSQKEANTSISTPNATSNNVAPTRPRSMKRGAGASSSHNSMQANGSLSQAPPTKGAAVETAPPNPGKSSGTIGESSRDNTHRDAGQRGGSFGNERSSFRSNSGPQPRGDGSYRHSHGGGRDPHRSFGSRESHAPQQRVGSRPFIRGPAPHAPFIPPPPPPVAVRPPFVTPMVYTEVPSPVFYVPGPHPDSLRPMPMVPYSPVFYSMPDPHLPSKIVNQIDYYFSNENLVKDTFLRQKMDGEGWVSIKLIATFKKVMQLTDNIQFIRDAIQGSNVVEVQGDKVRRKNDWMKWILPPAQYSTVTSPQAIHKSSQDMLAAQLNSISLDEKAAT